ncbi:MAG: xanthine dehydrogenase, partial [Acidobacteria bacterium]|nr:xanthine dehydrogenase [Acidobacteriota bacterium]
MSADIFQRAHELTVAGEPFVFATVVRAQSPTSAKPGNKAIITRDGQVFGWVGGSCAEPTVRKEAVAALADGQCRLVHLSPEPELPASRAGLTFVPMPCFSGGTMEIYIEPHLARPHLLVFGNSPVAHALARLGEVMSYRVTVVDLSDRPPFEPVSAEVVSDLDQLPSITPESTFAVVASHGMFDEAAIEKALSLSPA